LLKCLMMTSTVNDETTFPEPGYIDKTRQDAVAS